MARSLHSSFAFAFASTLFSSCACAQAPAPTFEQYPVAARYTRSVAPLRIASKQDREFRSRLAEASRQPVNFAGHYILTTIGCGAACVLTAVIDARTGRVAWLPFSLCCWDLPVPEPVQYRADSDLIVLNGQRNEGVGGTFFVRFVAGRFRPVAEAQGVR